MICSRKNFVYEWATETQIVIRDLEIAKEVFVNNHKFLRRFYFEDMIIREVMGGGLASMTGEKWSMERWTFIPFFHHDALKVR